VNIDTLQTLFRIFFKQETFEVFAERIWVPFVWAMTLCNLVGSYRLKMKPAAGLSETYKTTYEITRHHNLEDLILNLFTWLTFKNRASYIWDGRTANLQMLHFIYFFPTNISTEYFKHVAHSPFFSSKCRLFQNVTFFGSCIIHVLHTGCAKI